MANMGSDADFQKNKKNSKENKAGEIQKQKSNFRVLSALALVTQLGFIIGITTVGGVFLGSWLDTKMNTAGIFVIFGTLLGLTAGLLSGYRLIRRALK